MITVDNIVALDMNIVYLNISRLPGNGVQFWQPNLMHVLE